ncbi:hypothetical protein ACFL2V_11385 [Pseudomonadota bacterium]
MRRCQQPALAATVLDTHYDHDGDSATSLLAVNAIPVKLVSGTPTGLNFSLTELSNHPLGRDDVLEVDETATLALKVTDDYGNLVTTIEDGIGGRQDANFDVTVNVTGSATVDGVSVINTLSMLRGLVEFSVSDDQVEQVALAITAITSAPVSLPTDAMHELDFQKRLPAINAAAFETVHDMVDTPLLFTFTEAVAAGAGESIAITLDAVQVAGATAINNEQLHFNIDGGIKLARCYKFDTSASTLTGVAANDSVLPQQGEICSPDVAIPSQTPPYALEDSTVALALTFGNSINRTEIVNGQVFINNTAQAFNWNSGAITLPHTSGTATADGEAVIIRLEGSYLGESIGVANTISMRVLQIGADFDDDGLNNEVEMVLGLNPSLSDSDGDGTPDLLEDSDGDGLNNSDELLHGTKLHLSDSDGDGVSDGDEVNVHGSNPTNEHSDSDGIPDGLEVAMGSVLTDAASGDVAPYVTSLSVTPETIELIYSSAVSPVQLSVNAQLMVAGTEYSVDVTGESFGTVYSGGNTAVAQSTGNGVYQVLGEGSASLIATLGAHSAQANLNVQSSSEATVTVRLMPMTPEQKLYLGTDNAYLWFEVVADVPVQVLDVELDGNYLEPYYLGEVVDSISISANMQSLDDDGYDYVLLVESGMSELDLPAPNSLSMFMLGLPQGIPDDVVGDLTVIVGVWGEAAERVIELSLPAVNDPVPVATFTPDQSSTIDLQVGQVIDIPMTIEDPGMNHLSVQYLLDGEPLKNTLVFDTTVVSSLRSHWVGGNDVHRVGFNSYALEVLSTSDVQMELLPEGDFETACYGLAAGVYVDDGDLSNDDYKGRVYSCESQTMSLEAGSYIVVVGLDDAFWNLTSSIEHIEEGYYICSSASTCAGDFLSYGLTVIDGGGSGSSVLPSNLEFDSIMLPPPPAPPGTGAGGSGKSNVAAQMFTYDPVMHMDRVMRYQETEHFYHVTADDVGSHTLEIQATETLEDGTVRDTVVGTYTLNVSDPGSSCLAPTSEVLFPQPGDILYLDSTGGSILDSTGDGITPLAQADDLSLEWLGISSANARIVGEFTPGGPPASTNANFQPVRFKVDAPLGVESVQWTNAPSGLGYGSYAILSYDGAEFVLSGDEAYESIFEFGMTTLEFTVTSNCGSSSVLTVSVTMQADPAPAASINSSTDDPIVLKVGEIQMLDLQLTDAGRDLKQVDIVLIDPVSPDTPVAFIGHQSWIDQFEYYGSTLTYYDNLVDRDSVNVRIPVEVPSSVLPGSYEMLIVALDDAGQNSDSISQTVNILPPVPAVLSVAIPDNRIPAGESLPILYTVDSLLGIDRLEVSASGAVESVFSEIITFTGGPSHPSGELVIPVAANALPGDKITIVSTVYDLVGRTTENVIEAEVGLWGEQTIVVTGYPAILDSSMNYANVVVATNYAQLSNPSIRFNRLEIQSGATLTVSTPYLEAHDALIIDGTLRVNGIYDSNEASNDKPLNAVHGGDKFSAKAYGDFRNPRFPGARDNNGTAIGGRLGIATNSVTVNGLLTTQFDGYNAGGGVISITSQALSVNGVINADGNDNSAGGSVNINTVNISGAGTISANAETSGAGGRVAIRYDNYLDGGALMDGLALQAYENGSSGYGAGTVFLQRGDQPYGELYVLKRTNDTGYTTIRSVGNHAITAIQSVAGAPEQYSVTLEKATWPVPDDSLWEVGMVGTFVSLNGDDVNAPVYPVVGSVPPTDILDLEASGHITVSGLGSVQYHHFTVPGDGEVTIEVTDQQAPAEMHLFRNDGDLDYTDWVTGGDGGNYWNTKSIIEELPAGNYTLAISSKWLSSTEAIEGNNDAAYSSNVGDYSIHIYQAPRAKSIIVQSSVDITGMVGSRLQGVVRLDKLVTNSGVRLRSEDRIDSELFQVSDFDTLNEVNDVYTSAVINAGSINATTENLLYVANVNADSLMLDESNVKIYGDVNVTGPVSASQSALTVFGNVNVTGSLSKELSDINVSGQLNVTGDMTVSNSLYTRIDKNVSGLFGPAGTTESVRHERFTLDVSDQNIDISLASADGGVSWMLFKDDTSLDTADYITGRSSSSIAMRTVYGLSAGNYIVAIGRSYMDEYEAVAGITDTGGGEYSLTIKRTDDYQSTASAQSIHIGSDLSVSDNTWMVDVSGGVNVGNNVLLSQNAIITTPDADASIKKLSMLSLMAGGAVTIDAGSHIDLTGKGYPGRHTQGFSPSSNNSSGAHAADGGRVWNIHYPSVPYGDFINPRTAGSGGGMHTTGGGVVSISANELQLNGNISVNGGGPLGAGGSINLLVQNSVTGSGSIEASSGGLPDYDTTASGGRISLVYGDRTGFSGKISASAGMANLGLSPSRIGGAGTIFQRQIISPFGELTVDNTADGNAFTTEFPTALRSVGRHVITAAVQLSSNRWQLTVADSPWIAPVDSSDGLGVTGLWVDIDASNAAGPVYQIVDNTANTITIDADGSLSVAEGQELTGVIKLKRLTVTGGAKVETIDRIDVADADGVSLAGGKLIVGELPGWDTLVWPAGSQLTLLGEQTIDQLDLNTLSLKVEGSLNVVNNVTLNGTNAMLSASSLNVGGGIMVTDAGEPQQVDIIQTATTGAIGTPEALHYYYFTLLKPATVSIHAAAGDAMVGWILMRNDSELGVDDEIESDSYGFEQKVELDAGSYFVAVGIGADAYSVVNNIGWGLPATYTINIRDIVEPAVNITQLDVGNNFTSTDSNLVLGQVNVGGDLTFGSGTRVTVPDATYTEFTPLVLDVTGMLSVAPSARIELSGKGYPEGYLASFTENSGTAGSHGGQSNISAYGDYSSISFPGGGGWYSKGGGLINITADHLVHNGVIEANGESYDLNREQPGAGGGISINARVMEGSGSMMALGGNVIHENSWFDAGGGGGRVSIAYDETMSAYSGAMSVAGGQFKRTNYADSIAFSPDDTGSAGTIYVRKNTNQYGELIIDNTDPVFGTPRITTKTTPLRSIGRHVITDAVPDGLGGWMMYVSGYPWVAPTAAMDRLGLKGLMVDLNADDDTSPLYEVVDNGSDYLVVKPDAADSLSSVVGNALIGQIDFKRITLSGSAHLYTEDRLVVSDADGFAVSENSSITGGDIFGLNSYPWPVGASVNMVGSVSLDNLVVSDWSLRVHGVLSISNDLAVAGSNTTVQADQIDVGGNALVSGATIVTPDLNVIGDLTLLDSATVTVPDVTDNTITPLDIDVSGVLSVMDGSSIDVSAKGYPLGKTRHFEYYPPLRGSTYTGSHAGPGASTSPAAYGDFRRAADAGSGGYYQPRWGSTPATGSAGGGIVSIKASQLTLTNGSILADGESVEAHSTPTGAGGSVSIDVGILDGTAFSAISANGGKNSFTAQGSGGRMVIVYGDMSAYFGKLSANGSGGTHSSRNGTAGSIYTVHRTDIGKDALIVSNDDPDFGDYIKTNSSLYHPLQSVGRHVVTSAIDQADGTWEIKTNIAMDAPVIESATLTSSGVGSVQYHSFELTSDAQVEITLTSNIDTNRQTHILLFRDDSLLSTDDYTYNSDIDYSSRTPQVATSSLSAGKYIAVVSGYSLSTNEAVNGDNTHGSLGDYTISIFLDDSSQPFPASKSFLAYHVDLDASDEAGPYYEIVGQSPGSLIVKTDTSITLSAPGVQDMIGIIKLDSLKIGAETRVETEDRILITEPDGVQAGINSVLRTDWLIDSGSLNLPLDLTLDVTGSVSP